METYHVERYAKTRFWAVRAAAGALVCVCVYRRGAEEVAQRLQARDDAQRWVDTNGPAQEVAAPVVWVDPYPWLL
jgi:hypothetical protein